MKAIILLGLLFIVAPVDIHGIRSGIRSGITASFNRPAKEDSSIEKGIRADDANKNDEKDNLLKQKDGGGGRLATPPAKTFLENAVLPHLLGSHRNGEGDWDEDDLNGSVEKQDPLKKGSDAFADEREREQRKAVAVERELFASKCSAGLDILTIDECRIGGLAKGGVLRGGVVVSGGWSHLPCGCSLEGGSRVIHFKLTIPPSCTASNDYEPVCKFPSKCPAGQEVKSAEECHAAGLGDGGILRNGAVVVDDWGFTPCGCFISVGSDKAIHFDTGSANCAVSVDFEPVCRKQSPSKCPAGLEVQSKEECLAAGLADGGVLRGGAVVVGDWGHTPCGCFLYKDDNAIHFDNGSTNCVSSFEFEPVCRACARPTNWCGGNGVYRIDRDCDGDGINDHWCHIRESQQVWLIKSGSNCAESDGTGSSAPTCAGVKVHRYEKLLTNGYCNAGFMDHVFGGLEKCMQACDEDTTCHYVADNGDRCARYRSTSCKIQPFPGYTGYGKLLTGETSKCPNNSEPKDNKCMCTDGFYSQHTNSRTAADAFGTNVPGCIVELKCPSNAFFNRATEKCTCKSGYVNTHDEATRIVNVGGACTPSYDIAVNTGYNQLTFTLNNADQFDQAAYFKVTAHKKGSATDFVKIELREGDKVNKNYSTRRGPSSDKCPAGQEVKSAEDCRAAGLATGGKLRNGAVVVGAWGHTPCGCFHWGHWGEIHFDTGGSGCVPNNVICSDNKVQKTFTNLEPGTRYQVEYKAYGGDHVEVYSKDKAIMRNAVTHCGCSTATYGESEADTVATNPGFAGTPKNFQISQKLGIVTFSFVADSRCEEAYAFDRKVSDETKTTAFTPNFFYLARKRCQGDQVETGTTAADHLKLSQLTVGKEYEYCVRAVAKM